MLTPLTIPPGAAIQITTIGHEAVVLVDPGGEPDLSRLFEPGRGPSALVSFEVGDTELDRIGRVLAEVTLEAGEQCAFIFAGGLGDAFLFRSRLHISELAS
jgi:hypothetical protein